MNQTYLCILFLILCISGLTQGKLVETEYLQFVNLELEKQWPHNRTVNVVFHGHSVPSGYFRAGNVRKWDSYPHMFVEFLTEKYPTSVINCITTSIGGEQAEQGAKRFKEDVLPMKPDVLFIDYALNDRSIGLTRSESAWRSMIQDALEAGLKVVLLTPTPDLREDLLDPETALAMHSNMILKLGAEYHIPVVDVYAAFVALKRKDEDIDSYMSQGNHPNEKGHRIAVDKIIKTLYGE